MLAIIGCFIGLFGVIYMAAIGKTLGVLFAFMGFYLIVKQIYVDELENELERRELVRYFPPENVEVEINAV